MTDWWYITWPYANDDEKKAMDELVSEASDRAIGIIAASILEARLTEAIQWRLVPDDKQLTQDMFRDGGPFGSLSTKIQLAYLHGVISAEARKDMEYILKIRNRFAHQLLARDFQCDLIKDVCMNLKLVEENVREADGWSPSRPLAALSDPKSRYLYAINFFIHRLLTRYPLENRKPNV
jgi:DNA-binding MltR family transcriptional regulator